MAGSATRALEEFVVKIRLELDYPTGQGASYIAALEALDELARIARKAAASDG